MKKVEGYIPELNGLRGIAILLVLLHHYFDFEIAGNSFLQFIDGLFSSLWFGVDVFFVLSGFLITKILIKHRKLSKRQYFSTFYIRRILRIFPVYYFLLIISFTLKDHINNFFAMEVISNAINNFSPVYSFLYLQNWIMFTTEGWIGTLSHTWSLAIEEQFYLIWPFMIYFSSKKNLNRNIILWLFFPLILRCFLAEMQNNPWLIYMNIFTRADSLAFGAIVAVISIREGYQKKVLRFKRPINIVAILSILFLVSDFYYYGYLSRHRPLYPFLYSAIAYLSAFFLYKIILLKPKSFFSTLLNTAFLQKFGIYSYAIYLFHMMITSYFHHKWTGTESFFNQLSWFPLFLVTCYAVGWLSWNFIELPFIKLKNYFSYPHKYTPIHRYLNNNP